MTMLILFSANAVNCGGHEAIACSACGNRENYCNGDCTWKLNQCIPKGKFDFHLFTRYIY